MAASGAAGTVAPRTEVRHVILDSGTATVKRKINVANPGEKPVFEYVTLKRSRYGVLNYATVAYSPTGQREETSADLRIRVLQDRRIANHDACVLESNEGSDTYEVTRAFHGRDDESGELISDLTLQAVRL